MSSQFQIEKQCKTEWCWAAVAATIARYFYREREKLSQCVIAKAVLPDSGDCCSDNPNTCNDPYWLGDVLTTLCENLNRPFEDQPFDGAISFQKVKDEIDAGNPVCVRIQWFDEPRGHFVIIRGYSVSQEPLNWVHVADPLYEDSIVPYEEFSNNYLEAGQWTFTHVLSQIPVNNL